MKNLCTKFFRVKYVKFKHLSLLKSKQMDSCFRNFIFRVLLEVNKNCSVKVREGNISLWFDCWLNSKLLVANGRLLNSKQLFKDCWDSKNWDVAKLTELAGENKA